MGYAQVSNQVLVRHEHVSPYKVRQPWVRQSWRDNSAYDNTFYVPRATSYRMWDVERGV